MKRIFDKILALIPHAVVVLCLMIVTFLVTDYYNRPMAFINNDITKGILFALAILAMGESIVLIRLLRKKKWADYRAIFGEDAGKKKPNSHSSDQK